MLTGAYTELDDLLNLRQFASRINIHKSLLVKSVRAGDAKTRLRGRGLEFEEVRHYQAGDELRSLDWRVTARTGIPHTKLFREERERPIIVAVDQRHSMAFGSQQCFKSVIAAEIAAILSWAGLHQKDRVGALIFNDHDQFDLRPSGNRKTILQLLNQLCLVNQQLVHTSTHQKNRTVPSHSNTLSIDPALSLDTVTRELLRISKPGSSVFIISDFNTLSDTGLNNIARLQRHCNVLPILIYDQMEETLPALGRCAFTDGDTQLTYDTTNRQLRKQFTHNFWQRINLLSQQLLDQGIPLIKIATHQDASAVLQQLFSDKHRISTPQSFAEHG